MASKDQKLPCSTSPARYLSLILFLPQEPFIPGLPPTSATPALSLSKRP